MTPSIDHSSRDLVLVADGRPTLDQQCLLDSEFYMKYVRDKSHNMNETLCHNRVIVKLWCLYLLFHSILVYMMYSPGGVYPLHSCNKRDAFWVYPYPADGSQWNTTLSQVIMSDIAYWNEKTLELILKCLWGLGQYYDISYIRANCKKRFGLQCLLLT